MAGPGTLGRVRVSGERSRRRSALLPALLGSLLLAACSAPISPEPEDDAAAETEAAAAGQEPTVVTLAFAGDIHFEAGLAGLPGDPDATLGRTAAALRDADVAVVNLEGALTRAGSPTDKELEDPGNRYWFRSPPSALGVLARSGVDAVSVANNHGADYGLDGLRDTIAIKEDPDTPVSVIGVGRDRAEAFAPYRTSVGDTDVSVIAADASLRESADPIWSVGEGGPGLASARFTPPKNLLTAVRAAVDRDDLVVVYLHWGDESEVCPTVGQQRLAGRLADAGVDVIVGSHTHEVMGSGMLGNAYVHYGLGNYAWYHGRRPDSGVLRLRVTGGEVADEDWLPARTPLYGGVAEPRTGDDRAAAARRQADRRGCADLEPAPGSIGGEPVGPAAEPEPSQEREPSGEPAPSPESPDPALPAYAAEVREIGPFVRSRMTASFDAARCPVTLDDLRYLKVRHVDFAGEVRTGELVVAASEAQGVVSVFRDLYRARWPIARMRLVDAYDGDDDASMAANNSSAYNCRAVAGTDSLSDHAYGRAIDLNPVQNPYVTPGGVLPPAGREYADVDRSAGAVADRGVVVDDDVVVRAFRRIGWEWGDGFADYQHFFVP